MKVLSLLQPWATLVVIGAKKIETRSFNTKFKGTMLIHSSARMTDEAKALCQQEPFAKALKKVDELPLGFIIGKVDVVGTAGTDFIKACSVSNIPLIDGKPYSMEAWENEKAFGDYTNGRYGWLLKNPVAFMHHFEFSGGVGFTKSFDHMICLSCGCTDIDCRHCIEKTGKPCSWVSETLCSACK